MTFRFAYNILHLFGKKHIIRKWGKDFYRAYKSLADQKLRNIEKELPPGVDEQYDLNYQFICAYAPIYYALLEKGIDVNEIDMTIWKMNESIFNAAPFKLFMMMKANQKSILKLKDYQKKGENGLLGENDWILNVEESSDGSFYCRFTECGAYKVLNKAGYGLVFPCACRIDYLMANKSGFRFERTKTIGDGDSICENHLMGPGFTEWAPEKGFIDRK